MKKLLFLFLFSVSILPGIAGCGSSFTISTDTGTSGSLSDATASVVAEIGSTNQTILEDTTGSANDLADAIPGLVEDSFGESVGGSGGRFLASASSLDAAGDEGTGSQVDIDADEILASVTCGGGGSLSYAGTLTLTLDDDSASGSLSGTYTIIYDSCVEFVRLETATSTCTVETLIGNGSGNSVTNIINIDFQDVDQFDTQNNNFQIQSSVTSLIGFAVADGSSSTISYDYDININSNNSSTDLSGSLVFEGSNYDVQEIQDFVSAASASAICP